MRQQVSPELNTQLQQTRDIQKAFFPSYRNGHFGGTAPPQWTCCRTGYGPVYTNIAVHSKLHCPHFTLLGSVTVSRPTLYRSSLCSIWSTCAADGVTRDIVTLWPTYQPVEEVGRPIYGLYSITCWRADAMIAALVSQKYRYLTVFIWASKVESQNRPSWCNKKSTF